ncbi:hypothetical protein [Methanofollis fontis]|nr:hypothetical protein [Methanofollis fontis]
MMAWKGIALLPGLICLGILALTAGCAGIGFGDVIYSDGSLQVVVNNPGEAVDATVQVTVFSTNGVSQTEVANFVRPTTLEPGTNAFEFEVDLEPGTYKLYLYISKGTERSVSVIRDITV